MAHEAGQLIFVPTPIGNREDITLRALRLLREADLIACEDTRHTGPLLAYYGVHAPLLSYEKFNEERRAETLLDEVKKGKKVCLVSDAGMPGISDPGLILLRRAAEVGVPFTVLPGPSAGITAYVASGLGDGRYYFFGFLPRKGRERTQALERLDVLDTTAVIYEAPHRIRATLQEFARRWPRRRIVTCREWTKAFEERRSFLGEELVAEAIKEKGEYVIVLEAFQEAPALPDEAQLQSRIEALLAEGLTTKEVVQTLLTWSGRSKNDLYQAAINITKKK